MKTGNKGHKNKGGNARNRVLLGEYCWYNQEKNGTWGSSQKSPIRRKKLEK